MNKISLVLILIHKVDGFLDDLQEMNSSDLSFEDFITKASNLTDLNEIDTFGELDTFPDDYLLGVYLPLLIPILFPVVQATFFEIKRHSRIPKA